MMSGIRPAAVSGSFYPGEQGALVRMVDHLLSQAAGTVGGEAWPKAIIAPHAGYAYSGDTAAHAYAHMRERSAGIRRVVLLGPAHRVAVRGLALPAAECFATPLGTIDVDQDAVSAIRHLPHVVVSEAAHAREHSLEVQLPFLQRTLKTFRILPLAVGDTSPSAVAEVIEILWGGPETLIVISTDLSHYLPYDTARETDSRTVESILALDGAPIGDAEACGSPPVRGLILAAGAHRLRPQLLDLCNSGDTAGNRSAVVGYAAVAFEEQNDV
ncbi:MAG: AmmeMemoRadiSam system protein B [Acidiferrobacterales bacterium]